MTRKLKPQAACAGTLFLLICTLTGCNRMNAYVVNDAGQAHFARGEYALAQVEFQKALLDAPTSPDYTYNLASAYHKQGDYTRAEQMYQRAIQLDPSHQPAYHGLASLLNEQNRTADAHSLLQGWATAQPYQPQAHVELAWLQREQGDLSGAEATLQNALKLDPNHAVALSHLGQLYQDQGMETEALAMYKRSMYMKPGQEEVYERVAALEHNHDSVMATAEQGWNTGYPADATRMVNQPMPMMGTAAMPVSQFQPVAQYPHSNGIQTVAQVPSMPQPMAEPHQHQGHDHHGHDHAMHQGMPHSPFPIAVAQQQVVQPQFPAPQAGAPMTTEVSPEAAYFPQAGASQQLAAPAPLQPAPVTQPFLSPVPTVQTQPAGGAPSVSAF